MLNARASLFIAGDPVGVRPECPEACGSPDVPGSRNASESTEYWQLFVEEWASLVRLGVCRVNLPHVMCVRLRFVRCHVRSSSSLVASPVESRLDITLYGHMRTSTLWQLTHANSQQPQYLLVSVGWPQLV